jgi:hypothetical protein
VHDSADAGGAVTSVVPVVSLVKGRETVPGTLVQMLTVTVE